MEANFNVDKEANNSIILNTESSFNEYFNFKPLLH